MEGVGSRGVEVSVTVGDGSGMAFCLPLTSFGVFQPRSMGAGVEEDYEDEVGRAGEGDEEV